MAKNLFSHSRTLHFALSKEWGNSSTQGKAGRWGTSETLFGANVCSGTPYNSLLSNSVATLNNRWNGLCCILHQILLGTWSDPAYAFPIRPYLPKQIYILPNLCVLEAFRHLRALRSVSVLKCGTCNYQREQNQGILVKSKPFSAPLRWSFTTLSDLTRSCHSLLSPKPHV